MLPNLVIIAFVATRMAFNAVTYLLVKNVLALWITSGRCQSYSPFNNVDASK